LPFDRQVHAAIEDAHQKSADWRAEQAATPAAERRAVDDGGARIEFPEQAGGLVSGDTSRATGG